MEAFQDAIDSLVAAERWMPFDRDALVRGIERI